MSEPFASTNETQSITCKCGATTVQRKYAGMYGSAIWDIDAHDAPCGMPCFGGGVPGKAYRDRQFHGGKGPCPACGKVG